MNRFDEANLGFHRKRKEQQVVRLEEQAPRVAVTVRSVVIGLALVVVICIATPLVELRLKTDLLANFHIPVAPILILFAMVIAVNWVAWQFRGWLMLSKGEMLTIFCMTLVSAAIPSQGMMNYVFPLLSGQPYYATPENRYAEIFHQYLPNWFWPKDPAEWGTVDCPKVITWLYEGLPDGMGFRDIPWRVWIPPLGMFSVFIGFMYMLFFCLTVILRKQWDERERLPFPVAQIPLALVEGKGDARGEKERIPFLKSKAALLGMLLPFLVHTYNHLSELAVALPKFAYRYAWDEKILTEPPLNAFTPLEIYFFPAVLAIAFLISREVSLSIWVFFLLMKIEMAIAIWLGYGESMTSFVLRGHTSTMITGQGEGALLMFTMFGLWLARGHLKTVFLSAIRPLSGTPEERREALSYRMALIGLIVSLVGMAVWLDVYGMSFHVALPMLLLLVLFAIGLTRIAAEGGLVHIKTAGNPASMVEEIYGTRSLGPKNTTLLEHTQFMFLFEFQAFLMPSLMHAFKIGSDARLKRFPFVGALIASVTLAIVVSFGVFLWMGYTMGGIHLGFGRWPYYTSKYLNIVIKGRPPALEGLSWVGLGAVVMFCLMLLRQRFLWLPHPLGYVVFLSPFRINRFWLMLFLGWLSKWAVLKYGTLDTYYRVRRFFLGVLAGEFITVGLWSILDVTKFYDVWEKAMRAGEPLMRILH